MLHSQCAVHVTGQIAFSLCPGPPPTETFHFLPLLRSDWTLPASLRRSPATSPSTFISKPLGRGHCDIKRALLEPFPFQDTAEICGMLWEGASCFWWLGRNPWIISALNSQQNNVAAIFRRATPFLITFLLCEGQEIGGGWADILKVTLDSQRDSWRQEHNYIPTGRGGGESSLSINVVLREEDASWSRSAASKQSCGKHFVQISKDCIMPFEWSDTHLSCVNRNHGCIEIIEAGSVGGWFHCLNVKVLSGS